ncbi:hypothetical protein BCR35DRAFT_209510 [Leucosporidium creatinivorum]|uniref:Uncharacterized protein n=1 Tax=Leucosporidium creatinivorum TaxID=106004 RepID=A0A1Y2DFG9_9BASI|nr:hypothetical protein BCR35DRAFT_209510 [Leucosporidium creatinivorum]
MNQLFAVGQGKSWIVERLVKWVEESKEGREDLLICAAHMLAALGRKDEHCVSLVHEYGVAHPLGKIAIKMSALQFEKATNGTRPGEVTQILFGVVSLLRHLSIPVANKAILGDTGIIGPVSTLLQRELDIVGPLQNAVVGLLKHLTAANVPNSLRLLETPSASQQNAVATTDASPAAPSSPFDFVLALIPRTDDVRLRSEATRIVVNVVRTLFSTKPLGTATDLAHASPITPTLHSAASNGLDAEETMKRRGRPLIVRKEVAEALSEMVRLSERYPMLINEAVVGLTLLAGSGGAGGELFLFLTG